MQKLKFLFTKNFLAILLVIGVGLLAGKGLIGSGYFNMHDDLQVMRQLEMEKCFKDGQIPCRWVPDMGYGFGYPLFNFYPPLPYLVGQGIRLFGIGFIDTVKILFILSFVASGLTMYFLAKEFFGRFAALVATVFYVWAPYHAVDVYVRGAMNEAWALIWFPLILYSSYKLISGPSEASAKGGFKYVILLALAWFGLFTSHNLMVLIFTPFFAAWCLIWWLQNRKFSTLVYLAISGMWSLGLSAFFTLPVLFEKSIVQTDTLVVGYYEYTAHFPSINQLLFSRFWGYGPSVWMVADDKMSFQIGWVHWITSLMVLSFLAYRFLKKKDKYNDPILLSSVYMLALGWFAAFLAHPRSTFIWTRIDQLKFVQFPWRFLTLVILGMSFAAGYLVRRAPAGIKQIVGFGLILAVIVYSFNYFVPEHGKLGPITDSEKLSGVAWDMQQTAGIYDYLPNTAKTAPKAPQEHVAEVVRGEGEVVSASQGTDWARFIVNIDSDQSVVRINILQFPDWRVFIDGSEVTTSVPDYEDWGRIHVEIPAGRHEVYVKLYDTPVRSAGNYISLASWALLLGIILVKRKHA